MNDAPTNMANAVPPAITLDQLVVGRGDLPLTQPLSLTFAAGSLWQITGVNGSGKTSLLRVLAGLLPALGGQVTQNWLSASSAPIRGFDPEWQRQLAWHPVTPSLKPGPTVRETLAAQMTATTQTVADHLDHWGLTRLADQPVQYLSSGQRKRLDLARLHTDPRPIWLLDEPTVTLDKDARALLGEALGIHRDRGGLAIVASHDPIPVTGAINTLNLSNTVPEVVA